METIHIRDSDSEESLADPLADPLEMANATPSDYKSSEFATNHGAGYCRKQTYKLPKSFFHSPNNVYLLNKCQPLNISLVDCKKYPWHFWTNDIHLGLDHNFTHQNTNLPQVTKAVEMVNGSDNFKTEYDVNIKKSKNDCRESILADEKSKEPLLNQHITDIKKDTKIRHNIIENMAKKPCNKQLDFRKNKGLVGLKIKYSEHIQAEMRPLPCSQVIENATQNKLKTYSKSNVFNLDKEISKEKQYSKLNPSMKQAKQTCKEMISCEKKTDEEKTTNEHDTTTNEKTNITLKSSKVIKNSGVNSKATEKKNKKKEVTEKQIFVFPLKSTERINPTLMVQQNTQNNGIKTDNLVTNTLRQENTRTQYGGKAMHQQALFKEQIVSEAIEDMSPSFVQNHQNIHISNEVKSVNYENKISPEMLANYRSKISILSKRKNVDSGINMIPSFASGSQNKEIKLAHPSKFNPSSLNSNLNINEKVDVASAAQLWQHSCHTARGIPRNAYIYQKPEEQYTQGINIQNKCCNQSNVNPTSYPYFPLQPNDSFNVCSSSNNDTYWRQHYVGLQILPKKPPPSVLFDSILLDTKSTSTGDSVIGFNKNGIVRKINISEPKLRRQNNCALIRNNDNCNSYKQKHRILIEKIMPRNSNSECPRRIVAPGLTSIQPNNFKIHKKLYPELSKALNSAPKSTLAFKDVSTDEYHQSNSSSNVATNNNAAPYII